MVDFGLELLQLLQVVRTLGSGLRNVGQAQQGQDLVPHALLVGGVDVLDGSLAHTYKYQPVSKPVST